jgi:hypothetical protein
MPPSNILRLRASRSELSFASNAPSSSSTPAPTQALQRCHHCLALIPFESTVAHHIRATPECRAAEDRIICQGRASLARKREWDHEREVERRREQEREDEAQVLEQRREQERRREPATETEHGPILEKPAAKRRRVTVEEVEDEDATPRAGSPRLATPGPSMPSVLNGPSTNADAPTDNSRGAIDPHPGPPTLDEPRTPEAQPLPRGRGLRRWKGMYVEEFPDPLAGAPISSERAPEPNLDAYIQSTGRLGRPGYFEVADLLMTTGLTDDAKERHLKSTLVSTNINMLPSFTHRSTAV